MLEKVIISTIGRRASHLGRKDSSAVFGNKSKAQSGQANGNAKIWKLRSPSGDLIEIKSLKTWCKENNITIAKIHHNTKKNRIDDWTICS
jgi:hypothetical protein